MKKYDGIIYLLHREKIKYT